MNVSQISYQPKVINNNYNKQNQSVSFKSGEGSKLVQLLKKNNGILSLKQIDAFVKENYNRFRQSSIKGLLMEPIGFIAGLAASIERLTGEKTKLEDANQLLQSENEQLKQTLSDERKRLTEENTALKTMLKLEESGNILSKHSANDVLDLINVFQKLNINVNEGEIKQVLDNGITINDILKFYNLFNGENKEVKDELANTFIKEWILDGVTYDDLDKFLNLPYCKEYSDACFYIPMFLNSSLRYAQGVNAKLLTRHFNIKDMIYLSESKKLNLQSIYVIMDLINQKQIKLEDIKNMDEDGFRELCNQFDKSPGSDLLRLEEHLFCGTPTHIDWKQSLEEIKDMQKYNVNNPSDVLLKKLEEADNKFLENPEGFI